MKIVVIGRETAVGRSLVDVLRTHDPHGEVIPVDGDPDRAGTTWATTFAGAHAVVDVADAVGVPRGHAIRETVVGATRAALTEAEAAGTPHFVLVSSVGLGRAAENEHFSARLGAEVLVEASPLRHTIVRTTQLFESVQAVVRAGIHGSPERGRLVIQPIAARDVATEVAAILVDPPAKPVVALAGPERFHLDELVERYRLAAFHHREAWAETPTLVAAHGPTSLADLLRSGTATLTDTRFQDWVGSTP